MIELLNKIFSYFDLANVILNIVKSQLKPVVINFIDGLMASWQAVIDALPEGEEKEAKKAEAHEAVVRDTQAEFSESPSYVPRWVIDIYIKAKKAFENNNDGDATDKARTKGIMVNPENVEDYNDVMRNLGLM